MVTFVVIINTIISLILFSAANKLWRIKKQLAIVADCFITIEMSSHKLLCKAPDAIYLSKNNISNLRYEKQLLQLRIQQLQQIVSLIFFGRQIWCRYMQFSASAKTTDSFSHKTY